MTVERGYYSPEVQDLYNKANEKSELSPELIGDVFDSRHAQEFLTKNPEGFALEREYSGGELYAETTGLKVGASHITAIWERSMIGGQERKMILGYTLRPSMDVIRYFEARKAA